MRNPDDLARFVEQQNIDAQLVRDLGDTPTVPAAAAALGVSPDSIVKTLLFLWKVPHKAQNKGTEADLTQPRRRPIVVIGCGERRIDKKRLAAYLGVGAKRINMASADMVLELIGYPAGGVPPFGHATEIPVVMDAAIEQVAGETIYGGGGDDCTMLRLTVGELKRVVQPEVVLLSEE